MHLDLPVDKDLLSDLVNSVDKQSAAEILKTIDAAIDGRPRADVLFALGIAVRRVASASQEIPDPPSLRSFCGIAAAITLGKDAVVEAEAAACSTQPRNESQRGQP